MNSVQIILGIVIIVMAIALIVFVLMQSGSDKNLSGAISGAADTFFGKNKGKTADKILSRVTNIMSVAFAVIVLLAFLYTVPESKEEESSAEAGSTDPAAQVSDVQSVAASEAGSDAVSAAVSAVVSEVASEVASEQPSAEASEASEVAESSVAQ